MDWMTFVKRYPSAEHALKMTEEAIEKNRIEERKEHYEEVFGKIISAAQKGETSVRLQANQIEEYGMREHLESKGYKVGKPFVRVWDPERIVMHIVYWGEKEEDTDETV